MPSGTRLEVSNDYIAKVENIIRSVVPPKDLDMVVSNIGVYPDLSAIYTTNASMDTAFVQTSLKEDHSVGSYEYMRRVQEKLSREMPELSTYYQAGGLVDGVINQGLPAPIDIQIKSQDMDKSYALARAAGSEDQGHAEREQRLHSAERRLSRPGAQHRSRTRQPDRALGQGSCRRRDHRAHFRRHGGAQLLDRSEERQQLPGHGAVRQQLDQQHVHGGCEEHSLARRASRWISARCNMGGQAMPVAAQFGAAASQAGYVPLGSVADIQQINTPTEVDHNQIRRVIDIYVATKTEALQGVGARINKLLANTKHDQNTVLDSARSRGKHEPAFHDFGIGLIIAIVLVYLILMAQFASFIDPFIILMAIPPGLAGRCSDPAHYRQHAEHHVADGRHHDGRNRGFEQHSHRRIRRTFFTSQGMAL